ncbi:MAG: sigma-70 family RNA polymerase sigma factor [Ferruginibacter sp.]
MPEDKLYEIRKLLLQVGEADEDAFRAIFYFYKERFYSTALKITHSEDIAEEIVQEVFISLWIKRKQVASAANPEGYFFTMLNNSIYAHFRKLALEKAMKKKVVEQTPHNEGSPVEEMLLAKEKMEMLEAVISQLPAQQRIVYKLSSQQGLSREQIYQLHISPHTVKNHLQQAIRFIRTYYKAGASAIVWLSTWHVL